MLDISVLYNRFKFLGYEFLTWLWFMVDTAPERLEKIHDELTTLDIGNRIVFENSRNEAKETVTIKGDDAGLEEGKLALKKGAVVIELNLVYKSENNEWRFTVRGESLNLGNIKTPETGPIESEDDLEGSVLEKLYLHGKVVSLLEALYFEFIRIRVSNRWSERIVPQIKKWIEK